MKRIEIVANTSVLEDVVSKLERTIVGFQYTLIPVVHGRGPHDRKLGTTVWPEENFLLFSYLGDTDAARLLNAIGELKGRYTEEGIKAFVVTAEKVDV